ncbi:hypothetical protein IWZ00DRAFT_488577 [Phyllosticta capitalensis]
MSDPKIYTVGWICAVHTEYTAARQFLDEEHDGPLHVSPNDNNDYTLGKIKHHNVVIAVLPDGAYGLTTAAEVARDLLHTFVNVRIGLMVGIGGGAPTPEHDIRLGDIVVSSQSDGRGGGVFQYDFGKTVQDQEFQNTRFLNQPPTLLRAAVAGLRSRYRADGNSLDEDIDAILEKKAAEYTHRSGSSADCAETCGTDDENLVSRPDRTSRDDDPVVHYGVIASANQLMKDATIRDKLARERNVLCFEMEAAGLMNHFPCLIIRGICDYSDSHKNKVWQGYASMAAAAYAKALLSRIRPTAVEEQKPVNETLSEGDRIKDLNDKGRWEMIRDWLSAPDWSINFNEAIGQRHLPQSGRWFLKSKVYGNWKKESNSFLWLHGVTGSGKTVLTSAVIQELQNSSATKKASHGPPSSHTVLCFFFDFRDAAKQSTEKMIRSLILQLYVLREDSREPLEMLFSSCQAGIRQPNIDSLCMVFQQMTRAIDGLFIILDALNECKTKTEESSTKYSLLSWIKGLIDSGETKAHVLATSTYEEDTNVVVRQLQGEKFVVPMNSRAIDEDIQNYVHARVEGTPNLRRWQESHSIEQQVVEKADGMFRLASCCLDDIAGCFDVDSLEDTLSQLPRTLDGVYARMLKRISPRHKPYTVTILQFLVSSRRLMTIKELADAVLVNPRKEIPFDNRMRMTDPNDLILYCSGWVIPRDEEVRIDGVYTKTRCLGLAHSSIKNYLESDRLPANLAPFFKDKAAEKSLAYTCLSYYKAIGFQYAGLRSLNALSDKFPLTGYWEDHFRSHFAVISEEAFLSVPHALFCAYTNPYRILRPPTSGPPTSESDMEVLRRRLLDKVVAEASAAGLPISTVQPSEPIECNKILQPAPIIHPITHTERAREESGIRGARKRGDRESYTIQQGQQKQNSDPTGQSVWEHEVKSKLGLIIERNKPMPSVPKLPSSVLERSRKKAEENVGRVFENGKRLLQALDCWSRGTGPKDEVYRSCVHLRKDFLIATAQFDALRMNLTDLDELTDDLFSFVVGILGQEAPGSKLDDCAPEIGKIIIDLENGLRRNLEQMG